MRKDLRHHTLAPSTPLATPITRLQLEVEVMAWAKRLEVDSFEIRIRPMPRKWASCSARGRITLDVDLLGQPEPFRREVILHELLHLKVPNHGPLFRALLSTYLSTNTAS
jgi:predicted metal-dependent hydrolase